MVGIVIVSHSKQLAQGVQSLVMQMVQGKVSLAIAAGIDDPTNPLGTDVMAVHEAIASVYNDRGVVVLMDLGSALMSAEMALEFFPDNQRENIHLCEAPIVEGAIAAAVAAASGHNIQQVLAEARGALAAKASQLNVANSSHLSSLLSTSSTETLETSVAESTKEICVVVSNRLGLHARPAGRFVATVARFQSQIKVRNLSKNTDAVRADSVNQIATLNVRQGDELLITASGVDADEALAALHTLIVTHFGEEGHTISSPPPSPLPLSSLSQPFLQGIPASQGVAIAPIVLSRPTTLKLQQYHVEDVTYELQRLHLALYTAQQEVQALLSQASTQIGDAEAAIFDTHFLFLRDPVLLEAVQQKIREQHWNAEAAWQAVVDQWVDTYRNLDDPYLQARATDVIDIGQRVLRLLLRSAVTELELSQPAILIANDLTPSETAKLDSSKILGICTIGGSAISHSAIIARRLGIPAVVGVPKELMQLAEGTTIALDGETGRVWIEPGPETIAILETKRNTLQVEQQQAKAMLHQPAMTQDGWRISVFANIGNLSDAQTAISLGAEGVGLLRTEFLYLERTTPPSEQEQVAAYQAIAQVLDTRPLIIRTLDVGGDKPLPYIDLPPEANPSLGCRGIRFCLHNQDLFKTQLRAILRASSGYQMKIMFPMVATLEEIRAAKNILSEVQAELKQADIHFDDAMEVGIMVEIPSAVVIADQLAAEVDFFSIGTNDLTQYLMAADRTHPRIANLVDALYPAVLRMIQQSVQAAHKAGIWVGLCGELASDPQAAMILLGLGLDEVSLNPQAIPNFKQMISQLTMAEATAIAQAALQKDSADCVRALISSLDL